jgi:hypothetical protein
MFELMDILVDVQELKELGILDTSQPTPPKRRGIKPTVH